MKLSPVKLTVVKLAVTEQQLQRDCHAENAFDDNRSSEANDPIDVITNLLQGRGPNHSH